MTIIPRHQGSLHKPLSRSKGQKGLFYNFKGCFENTLEAISQTGPPRMGYERENCKKELWLAVYWVQNPYRFRQLPI
jgi:hypothetical protein